MDLVGYADRFSVQRGETIRFMVSSARERYRADLVRLIHGDTNPAGPGFKERPVPSSIDAEYPGRLQMIHSGSYVVVPKHSALALTGGFTLHTWIFPTTPGGRAQGIIGRWSDGGAGWQVLLDETGSLSVRLGYGQHNIRQFSTEAPLRAREWSFISVEFDPAEPAVVLIQEPLSDWPDDPTRVWTCHDCPPDPIANADVPLLIAALAPTTGYFNGKIDNPRLFGTWPSVAPILPNDGESIEAPLVAAWDFAADIASKTVRDLGPHALHGETVNAPTRGVTGATWTGAESNPRDVPEQYRAIHFHEEDLDDAGWESDFALTIPEDLPSGVYAARLQAADADDYVPFIVRTPAGKPTAPVAVLFSTFTYLAYANEQGTGNEYASHYAAPRQNPDADARELVYLRANKLLSLYDFHADGSGVCLSSLLRPILNLRPKARMRHIDAPHGFAADFYLTDWLDHEAIAFDVIADEDVHTDGLALLEGYNVVVTGSHPEYWTGPMLDALEAYLAAGGRLMYLGGNGFYWVTSVDAERPHVIEVRRWGGTGAWKAEPGEYHHATTGELGGLWRHRGRVPQRTVGVGFTAQGFDTALPYRRRPDSHDPRVSWIFAGIGDDEPIGDCPNLILGHGAAGHEVDRYDRGLGTPAHTFLLATATGFSDGYQAVVEEILMADSRQGGTVNPRVRADMTYLTYPNGGAVFSVGSIAWIGSLSANGYDNTVAKVTGNVLRRFAE
jgi:N,N-dimethylformamidase